MRQFDYAKRTSLLSLTLEESKYVVRELPFSSSNPILSEVERKIIHQLELILSSSEEEEKKAYKNFLLYLTHSSECAYEFL
jgi:hypothetical protein